MPRKAAVKLSCPICKKTVKSTDPDFPFCSDRCRIIDLGKWASGGYVVSSPVTDAEDLIQDFPPENRNERSDDVNTEPGRELGNKDRNRNR